MLYGLCSGQDLSWRNSTDCPVPCRLDKCAFPSGGRHHFSELRCGLVDPCGLEVSSSHGEKERYILTQVRSAKRDRIVGISCTYHTSMGCCGGGLSKFCGRDDLMLLLSLDPFWEIQNSISLPKLHHEISSTLCGTPPQHQPSPRASRNPFECNCYPSAASMLQQTR